MLRVSKKYQNDSMPPFVTQQILEKHHRRQKRIQLSWAPIMLFIFLALTLLYIGMAEAYAPPETTEVVVRQGDTLWGIAKRVQPQAHTGRLVWQIRHTNGLESATIQPGASIKVPIS